MAPHELLVEYERDFTADSACLTRYVHVLGFICTYLCIRECACMLTAEITSFPLLFYFGFFLN